MNNTTAQNIASILSFLPAEPGLRAHVLRVGALAGRAVQVQGGSSGRIQFAEFAGFLHHYIPDTEAAGAAKLLADLGFKVSSTPALPKHAQQVLEMMADSTCRDHEEFAYVESANLFDEQFENLPYEDLSTEDAVEELIASGMLSDNFVAALQALRSVSSEQLLDSLRTLRLDVPGSRWSPLAGQESLLTHSLEVAQSATDFARESKSISEADAYLGGVFHDIGRVAFQNLGVAGQCRDWMTLGFPVTYAEYLISGTDHAAIGAELLSARAFPDAVVEGVRYHHRLELSGSCLAAALYAAEDGEESLPSCARDHLAAKRLEAGELRCGNAAG